MPPGTSHCARTPSKVAQAYHAAFAWATTIVTCDRIRESLSGLAMSGIRRWMKKTLHVDDALLASARAACGAGTDTETVRLGLEALLRRAAYEHLRALRGTEPVAQPALRRREKPARKVETVVPVSRKDL